MATPTEEARQRCECDVQVVRKATFRFTAVSSTYANMYFTRIQNRRNMQAADVKLDNLESTVNRKELIFPVDLYVALSPRLFCRRQNHISRRLVSISVKRYIPIKINVLNLAGLTLLRLEHFFFFNLDLLKLWTLN